MRALHPVLLCGRFDAEEQTRWLAALQFALPEVQWLDLQQAREITHERPAAITAAVVANPVQGPRCACDR